MHCPKSEEVERAHKKNLFRGWVTLYATRPYPQPSLDGPVSDKENRNVTFLCMSHKFFDRVGQKMQISKAFFDPHFQKIF